MVSLDDLDYRIIRLLQEDARMSSREMTRRIGDISDRVVRYRIKRLVDHKIVFLQAIVNPHRVGFPIIADILIEVAPWKLAEACAKLADMSAVSYVSASNAGRHVSVEVNARTEHELMTFVQTTLPQLDGIVNARTMVVPNLIKDVAFWKIPR
jgi:DNA-binding Lrp family transcriptional regulator